MDQPPDCKCGLQLMRKDGLDYLYMCQRGEAGCGMDLEGGCDVVVAENPFIRSYELYPYVAAAVLAGYITYVVDMQCADVDAADANSRRVKHVYSLHESNKAVIQRQMSEWAPVDMRVMPKQIKVIECPYGKSKAHIVLAHIFACEAFQTQPQPALGAQVVSNSDVGQTLALDWKLQCTDANPSPDRKVEMHPSAHAVPTGTAEDAQQTERRKGSFASAKPVPEQADSPGLGNDADANDFYLRHCGSPVTAGQKGKAPIQHVGESKPKWWPDNDEDDEDLCQIMEDLSGAGIRSRFDDQKVMLPDST
ncbi:hypothetical protein WJX75_005529 [Coccomyxa subellipsoidea]|uniref:Uncharacterized protein n=1 Tax=Coccomyxa subellipsoidea TaxID=248742 RepID=A0ABR2YPY3_9CHLO